MNSRFLFLGLGNEKSGGLLATILAARHTKTYRLRAISSRSQRLVWMKVIVYSQCD
ncbi:hypothetical protein QWZ16_23605 [Vibrio ostreicida]|uniref:Uncharacterized protein n=1 Tax=Vibrio ostreicida TaxID=526588 RepID=A0ABT8BYS9_9VIBR|nr:hypothetical protein [Vibrio ostreicida]MDN3611134.1 hypothetical protein [Vibrio ostreicida]MDN3611257.1 hypothetical protein [Vibrio ostreicida]MDN3612588.1 hypothetical protein [Vibrio ostreicida]